MKKLMNSMVLALACGLLLMGAGKILAADEPAKVAGTWEMSSEGPNGTMTQTLTITQDGGTIKGTITGRRGDAPLEGTVAGSKVSFTVKRQTQSGDTMVIEYTATVDGDSMKGKVHSERFGDRDFTAKRTK
ncbi:MAG TPA: hypothetical protein VKO18_18050 [Terriglobia bacterium]|nr:hypothetical protein [Terriglobia bacterium]